MILSIHILIFVIQSQEKPPVTFAFSLRISIPILSKRPRPFMCSSDSSLAVNNQLNGPVLIKSTTESSNITMEKSNIAVQPEKTTGITNIS